LGQAGQYFIIFVFPFYYRRPLSLIVTYFGTMEVDLSNKLYEEDLASMALVYRDMANQTYDAWLSMEFTTRAQKYETAVWAVERVREAKASAAKRPGLVTDLPGKP
jgi:hypothetical protein